MNYDLVRYGAISAFIGGNPPNKIIPKNSYTQLTLKKLKHSKVQNCQDSNESAISCTLSKVAEEFMQGPIFNPLCLNFTLCKIPQIETLLEQTGYNLDTCNITTLALYQCIYSKAAQAGLTKRAENCQNPCKSTSYEISTASIKHPQNITILSFQFISTDIEIHEELFIYNFSAIVSSIGGLLGLFVGVSFLDIGLVLVDYVYSRFKICCFTPQIV